MCSKCTYLLKRKNTKNDHWTHLARGLQVPVYGERLQWVNFYLTVSTYHSYIWRPDACEQLRGPGEFFSCSIRPQEGQRVGRVGPGASGPGMMNLMRCLSIKLSTSPGKYIVASWLLPYTSSWLLLYPLLVTTLFPPNYHPLLPYPLLVTIPFPSWLLH